MQYPKWHINNYSYQCSTSQGIVKKYLKFLLAFTLCQYVINMNKNFKKSTENDNKKLGLGPRGGALLGKVPIRLISKTKTNPLKAL